MTVLCLYESADGSRVCARVQVGGDPTLEEPAWVLRYAGTCEGRFEMTANAMLRFLEHTFASRQEAPGLFRAPYAEVRAELKAYLHQLGHDGAQDAAARSVVPSSVSRRKKRPSGPAHGPLLRVLAAAVSMALLMGSVGLQVLVCFVWPVVIAFRRQSSLYAAAETAYLFTVLDWRRSIHFFARVALGQRLLWPDGWWRRPFG